ncbi:dienelactone hydrolase family protein [Colletotrichum truncatum]|uniref:Dienelactone hydrolase family protein n=1 Tax=Colletotrichum truncatum TaxID=5467 RepID=A0ACC3ZEQ6_COLTU|nr:dienelactone hydrolase family protein [Colletotrichum truncatum]KAF6801483.1 dienelactone hydrolase family protein [Colletotrichum truncatum]
MASSQSPRFCADCFKGTLRGDVVPQGNEETINGLPTYVARPDAGREPAGVVVILPDALGWTLRNTRGLADAYAKRIPAVVLVPEFMNGNALPDSILTLSDRIGVEKSWWYKIFYLFPVAAFTLLRYVIPLFVGTRSSVVVPRIANYLRALRVNPPSPLPPPSTSDSSSADVKELKIGVAGFCWGGKYTVLLTQGAGGPFGEQLVDVGFTAHPSMVNVPSDFEKVVLPLSVANGDNDSMMGRARMVQTKEVLGAKENCEVVEYPGAVHGFAVRGDPKDERQGEFGMRAEDQAVGWFRRWFGQGAVA